MLKKDDKKIREELKKLIEKFLLTEFIDLKGKPVESVEYVNIINIEYDPENEDRKKVIVKEVIADVRVYIQFLDNSTSSLNTQFINNKPIEFIINFSTDEIEIVESDVKFTEQKLF